MPSKWSSLAAMIGIPVGIVSLLLALVPLVSPDPAIAERNQAMFQAAQELRHNHEWLSDLSIALSSGSKDLPTGSLRTVGVSRLVQRHHDWLFREAYGEEKHMHQHILALGDLSIRLGTPASRSSLNQTLSELDYTLDDIHFLNNFVFWYIRPHIVGGLSSTQLYTLGMHGLPDDKFDAPGGGLPRVKRFVHDGQPIAEYSTYLGLID